MCFKKTKQKVIVSSWYNNINYITYRIEFKFKSKNKNKNMFVLLYIMLIRIFTKLQNYTPYIILFWKLKIMTFSQSNK